MTSDALLTAAVVLDALEQRGLRDLFLCPGSRSAPFAYEAAGRDGLGLAVHVRLDERSAAFHALGAARAAGRPAAVVTTSGTAAGNLLPAVMEAHHAGVPLVAITADRPPELRGTGANQTTAQPGLFAGFVRAEVDVVLPAPVPSETGDTDDDDGPRADLVRTAVLRALEPALTALEARAAHEIPGPVHLNIALRDPLQPEHPEAPASPGSSSPGGSSPKTPAPLDGAPAIASAPPTRPRVEIPALDAAQHRLLERLAGSAPTRRSVVVAGDGAGTGAAQLASALGLPLLAEPSSQARRGPTAVGPYRALLDTDLGAQIDRVLLVGRPTLSRPVAALLKRTGTEVAAWRPRAVPWFDDSRRPERELPTLEEAAAFTGRAPQEWTAAWREAGDAGTRRALQMLERSVRAATAPGGAGGARAGQADAAVPGPLAARAVWEACRADGRLLVMGSSNPIRDLDLLGAPDPEPGTGVEVLANRGLAGIDGLVATAAGAALATGRPARALLGDLTLLHDAGSLLGLRAERIPPLQIVVLDDRGGGIFSTLEHGALGETAAYRDPVERFFGTPPTADIAALCTAYGVPAQTVQTPAELEQALRHPAEGLSAVVVTASRAGLRATSQELTRAVRG